MQIADIMWRNRQTYANSIYIYIYLYIYIYITGGPFSRSRAQRHRISQIGPGAKNWILVCMVSDAHFIFCPRPRQLVWGPKLESISGWFWSVRTPAMEVDAKAVEMMFKRSENSVLGIIKNIQNAQDILQKLKFSASSTRMSKSSVKWHELLSKTCLLGIEIKQKNGFL